MRPNALRPSSCVHLRGDYRDVVDVTGFQAFAANSENQGDDQGKVSWKCMPSMIKSFRARPLSAVADMRKYAEDVKAEGIVKAIQRAGQRGAADK